MAKTARVSHGTMIDIYCTETGELVVHNNNIYSCTLNQTDICGSSNTNKFYIMQLINDGYNTSLYTRYGRIGEKGVIRTKTFCSINSGIKEFEKLFKNKTGNNFHNKTFSKISGKYNVTQIEFDDQIVNNNNVESIDNKIPDSSLDPDVQDLITMLSDLKMMNSLMVALDIDTQKMPLGKLNTSQIQQASSVLDQIDDILKSWETSCHNTNVITQQQKQQSVILPKITVKVNKSRDGTLPIPINKPKPKLPENYNPEVNPNAIKYQSSKKTDGTTQSVSIPKTQLTMNEKTYKIGELSSNFYTYIPYSSGRNAPPLIYDHDVVSKYRDMLDELAQTVVTAQIIKDGNGDGKENPIDCIYNGLGRTIIPLDHNKQIYSELVKYVSNTHGPTHYSKLKVQSIFEINNKHKKSTSLKNKILLFHGTPQSCVLSIFKNDFYLDPGKMGINVTGKMFGHGVYFADVVTKSFNYTHASSTGGIGCLLVCEIALGNTFETLHGDQSLNKHNIEKRGYQSTSAKGQYAPSSSVTVDDDGVVCSHPHQRGVTPLITIPNGKIIDQKIKGSLIYNEYIVYDLNQIEIKYLIVVKG